MAACCDALVQMSGGASDAVVDVEFGWIRKTTGFSAHSLCSPASLLASQSLHNAGIVHRDVKGSNMLLIDKSAPSLALSHPAAASRCLLPTPTVASA